MRRLNSADMFGGITESDLDTSSSEDDDEDDSSDSSPSGYASPKSGFNTPEANQKDEPTQVGTETRRSTFIGSDCMTLILML